MNFAELDEEDDHGAKVQMMNTYDRLLRLRNVLEFEENSSPIPKHELYDSVEKLKAEYIEKVSDVLTGYLNLHSKKEKASLMLSIIDKFGNKDIKYVQMLSQLVEQFDEDEGITEQAAILKEKTTEMLSLRNVFSLCTEADIMSKYMCFVCLERPVDTFIDPCGHVICQTCSSRSSLHVCPFCRGSVRQFRTMYLG
jgi:predicted O-linked N-acetylglucosamine transferase (SPINDLY family)